MVWLAGVAALGLLAATRADARAEHISIPAEDASASIPALAKQSGLQVFAPAEALRGVRTNAVEGDFPPLDALGRLLAGTGLTIVKTGDNAATIRRAGASSPTAAEATAVEGVVVTGSRIKRAGFDTLEAALTTGSKEIEQRGYENIADALQDTPGFGVPGSSPLAGSQARVGIAQSFADFFGLGSQRTLTLVDGRRFVSSNTVQTIGSNAAPGAQVDLNLIPVGLIDHVETIAIGGAPVYGSDAIAGTVNVILKQNFQGLQATAQYGFTDRGDGQNERFSILAGRNFNNGRGNIVFAAEYDQQDGVRLSDRSGFASVFPNPADTGPNDGIPASIVVPNVRLSFVTEGGLPYDGSILNIPGLTLPGLYPNGNYIHNASGQPLMFAPNGDLVPFNVGHVVFSVLGGLVPIESSGGDGVNAADHTSLLSPTKRILVNLNGHYDLTPHIRAFWETSYANTRATLLSDLTSIDAPNLFSADAYTLNFSVDNPYLSQQARSLILADGLSSFNLSRNLNDVVDRRPATSEENVYRVVGGFDGDVHVFGQDWSWDLSADYGASREPRELSWPRRLPAPTWEKR
ncbi:MAG: TonB-dependent receptor plug domain-containing protein [Caulobacteraceae bacterium]